MNVWRCAGAFVFVCAVALGVTAYVQAGEEKLVWKAFDSDKPFWQEMTTKTKQTMKVQNMEVVQDQTQTFWIKWTPKAKDKDGNWVVEQEIVGVKMNIKIGGNEIAFDSKDTNPPNNPLTDFFKALVGSKFTLTISPKDLKVTNVEGLDKFVDKLATANDQLKPLLKSILSKEALIQMSEPTFAAFPKDGVMKKDGWKYDVALNMGPIGTYNTSYTYKPNTSDKTKIDVTATMTYKAPDEKSASGLPFIIKGGELKADKAEGWVTVDPAAGRIKESNMKVDLKGNLKIDIGGMETTVELTQNQESTLKTLTDDPITTTKK
jgi:Family of unknown function (DUF6263)